MKQENTLVSSLRSSSSRRESPPGSHQAKAAATANVGCMSGIFKLISNKYHTRRKFLTFRKRQETHAPPTSQPQKQPKIEPITCTSRDQCTPCKATLQQQQEEVRNSCSSPKTPTSSPPVVARLMGLADIPPSPVISKVVETAAEKRRKLLGALERCDEDLRALKKIIEAARVTQTPPQPTSREAMDKEEVVVVDSDEPSPVSVLDHHCHEKRMMLVSRSPCLIRNGQALQQQETLNRQSRQYTKTKKKPGQEDHNAIIYLPNYQRSSSIMETIPQSFIYVPAKRRRPLVFDSAATTLVMRCSAAMQDTVSEVSRDLAQGQRREVGRLALILQDIIYGDLLDEIIKDFGGCYCYDYCFSSRISLPFEACKRQLCF